MYLKKTHSTLPNILYNLLIVTPYHTCIVGSSQDFKTTFLIKSSAKGVDFLLLCPRRLMPRAPLVVDRNLVKAGVLKCTRPHTVSQIVTVSTAPRRRNFPSVLICSTLCNKHALSGEWNSFDCFEVSK